MGSGSAFGAKRAHLQAQESSELEVIKVFLTTHQYNKMSWVVGSMVIPEILQEEVVL